MPAHKRNKFFVCSLLLVVLSNSIVAQNFKCSHKKCPNKKSQERKKSHKDYLYPKIINPQSPIAELKIVDNDKQVLSFGAGLNMDYLNQNLTSSYKDDGPNKAVISLVSLSALLRVNNRVSAFGSMVYTDSANSTKVKRFDPDLNQAYILIGNLKKSPWHASAGLMYFPFGVYIPFSFTTNIN